jgi:hypothetical protein
MAALILLHQSKSNKLAPLKKSYACNKIFLENQVIFVRITANNNTCPST